MPTKKDATNQATNQHHVSVTAKSHTMNVELHLGTELHSCVELQNEVEEHYDFEFSVHERDIELPNREVYSNS